MKPAIFLDRDGTIIKDKGNIGNSNQVEFYTYTFDCLRQLQNNFLLFIITNQPGIAKGMITLEQVDAVNLFIINTLKKEGINIMSVYCCPHQKSDNCQCRKPKTYFLEIAQSEFAIDMGASYVIGDHPSDVELALNLGAKGIYVLTGHGKKHHNELTQQLKKSITIGRNLEFAKRKILSLK